MAIVTPEGVRLELAIAGIGSRLAARLLDSLIQGAVSLALFWVVAATTRFTRASGQGGIAAALFFLTTFAMIFLYDLIFELAMHGQTPGKRATGLRVLDATGAPATPISIIIRNVARIIDFLPIWYAVGIVSMLVSQRTQRLGDFAAHTIVVRERKGNARDHQAMTAGTILTVPPEAVALWDVSAVSADEVQLCRHFLQRRFTIPDAARYQLSIEIATRLAGKVTGLPQTCHPEFVIEGVVRAKELRQ